MNRLRIEIHGDMVWLICDQHVHEMDPAEAWDFGDDLMLAAQRRGYSGWSDSYTESPQVDVRQDAEGEHEDSQPEPSEADAAGDTGGGTGQQGRGDDVQDNGEHGG